MIDWKKETTGKNYCGYCAGSPPSANCDGSCFTHNNYSDEVIKKNKIDHILIKLKEIPEEIESLRQKEAEFKKELEKLNNG